MVMDVTLLAIVNLLDLETMVAEEVQEVEAVAEEDLIVILLRVMMDRIMIKME